MDVVQDEEHSNIGTDENKWGEEEEEGVQSTENGELKEDIDIDVEDAEVNGNGHEGENGHGKEEELNFLTDPSSYLLCGVCDGHGGSDAADYVSENLHHLIHSKMADVGMFCEEVCERGKEEYVKPLEDAFILTDTKLR